MPSHVSHVDTQGPPGFSNNDFSSVSFYLQSADSLFVLAYFQGKPRYYAISPVNVTYQSPGCG